MKLKKLIFHLIYLPLLCYISLSSFTVSAHYVQQLPYCSIKITNGRLKAVIDMIEKQTKYRFLYAANERTNNLTLTLNETQQPLDAVLLKMEKQTHLHFEIAGETIYVKEGVGQKKVSGVVNDHATGETLPAVSISIIGTSIKTLTNNDGYFEIQANPRDTLLFNYIGYKTQKLSAQALPGTIPLVADQSQLEEVVVIGYGSQSRKLVSTSVATVTQQAFNQGGFNNPAQLLQGKVAGLSISRSGDPNAAPSISLRGPSTLRAGAAQEPFYVIDGVPGADFRLISPDDIEDISVLKDASATAIYGTRAANGVIMITTKRGLSGGTQVVYNGYVGTELVARTIDMMDSRQRQSYLDEMGRAAKPMDEQGMNTDWQEEISQRGMLQNHHLALNGGINKTNYSASVNYFKHKGILRKSGLDRLIGRLNLSQTAFNDHLTLGLNLSNSSSTADLIPNQELVLYNALRYMPTVPVRQTDGSYTEDLPRVQYYNPVALQDKAKEQLKTSITLLNLTAALKLPFGFIYDLHLSTQKEQNNGGSYFDSDYSLKQGFNGEAYRSSYENTRKMAESYLTFERDLQHHHIRVLGGYSWQEDLNGDGFQANNRNFPTDDLGYSNIGLGSPLGNFRTDWGPNQYAKLRLISFYGRLNYNFHEKYLVQLSLRRDASSAFGSNNRWGTFPAGSVAWRLTEEPFLSNQTFFDELKIRAGYGVTGNSLGFNPLISKSRYGAAGTFYYNGDFTTAIFATQNANPDLKWEKTAMANIGFDASLLKGRFHISAEYYDKKTSDLIWDYNVSTTQYFVDKYTANVGDIRNRGVELSLDATPIEKKDFRWQTNFNIAHNQNKLVSLSNAHFASDSIPQGYPGGQGQSGVAVQILKAGYPVGQFFTFRYAGKDEEGVSQFYDKNGNITTQPIDFQDYHYAGNAQPKILLGWSNTFYYQNIDLNIFLRGSFGGSVFNATLADLNRPYEVESYNLPVFSTNERPEDGNANRYSDRYIEKASYLRLDNASIGYTFSKIKGIQNLRVYLTGNNLALITGYSGIDPEINLGGLTPGIDNKNYYPRTRSFLFGFNVTF